jgi:hypothetical protein
MHCFSSIYSSNKYVAMTIAFICAIQWTTKGMTIVLRYFFRVILCYSYMLVECSSCDGLPIVPWDSSISFMR